MNALIAWIQILSYKLCIDLLYEEAQKAQKELEKAYSEMDHRKIQFFLQNIGADYINWHMNLRPSSHIGGVWERQMRSVLLILMSLLHTYGRCVNELSLRTLLVETESIINSSPLTVDTLGDV